MAVGTRSVPSLGSVGSALGTRSRSVTSSLILSLTRRYRVTVLIIATTLEGLLSGKSRTCRYTHGQSQVWTRNERASFGSWGALKCSVRRFDYLFRRSRTSLRSGFMTIVLGSLLLAGACTKETVTSKGPSSVSLDVSASKEQPVGNKSQTGSSSFKPRRGFVPDEQTAIAIAVAEWNPIYGRKQIESERPFHATLETGVWTVTGTLPPMLNGGTAVAEIAQDDGRILRVIHNQ